MKTKLLALPLFLFGALSFFLAECWVLANFDLTQKTLASWFAKPDTGVFVSPVMAMAEFDEPGAVLLADSSDRSFLKDSVVVDDARPLIIRDYLEQYDSPLLPYWNLIFDASQKYGLDYRLIVAIAQQESNLCKKAPANCFNCWGVGIHSRGTMCFDSYPEGIEWVADYLKEEYYLKGMTDPEEIMKKYCPLSDGSCAFGVKQFMSELE
ncbi:MAG: hypothetical protein ABID04_02520 [Patescibacteria group bacterium]